MSSTVGLIWHPGHHLNSSALGNPEILFPCKHRAKLLHICKMLFQCGWGLNVNKGQPRDNGWKNILFLVPYLLVSWCENQQIHLREMDNHGNHSKAKRHWVKANLCSTLTTFVMCNNIPTAVWGAHSVNLSGFVSSAFFFLPPILKLEIKKCWRKITTEKNTFFVSA